MINMILKKTALPLLVRQLNMNSLQQKVISHNIANVNTTDYKAKEVRFDDILNNSINIKTTHENHLSSSANLTGYVINGSDQEIKSGINNVDIDQEMVELAKNQMEFSFSTTILARLFKSIKSCIRGRAEF